MHVELFRGPKAGLRRCKKGLNRLRSPVWRCLFSSWCSKRACPCSSDTPAATSTPSRFSECQTSTVKRFRCSYGALGLILPWNRKDLNAFLWMFQANPGQEYQSVKPCEIPSRKAAAAFTITSTGLLSGSEPQVSPAGGWDGHTDRDGWCRLAAAQRAVCVAPPKGLGYEHCWPLEVALKDLPAEVLFPQRRVRG